MQDIAGCRVVVAGLVAQDETADKVCRLFPVNSVVDRRKYPSYGYRAVHVIARIHGRPVEIQIRTRLQHGWAETVEKYAEQDPDIKYGGGSEKLKRVLLEMSDLMSQLDYAFYRKDRDVMYSLLKRIITLIEPLQTV